MIRPPRLLHGWLFCICFFTLLLDLRAQPGASVTNLPKPKKYERRILASEKSDQGKFNPVKRANQNLNTRYNFYFNSERKMNDIMANAKSQHRDDYSLLLPFYNYELDATASQRQDLDSIIMRCNDAILLHDLRSDWVDDCYLMMGKAYFLRKEFDSAAIAFQYINFAFQPRTKDEMGYNKVIGSNANETGNVYTISTKEKKNPVNSTIGHTPARNEAILWLLRTLIQQERYNEAAGLVVTLRQDANFPSRLKADLNELQALMYYDLENYDSATHYLEQALDNAATPQEKARWEFLLAQMHENTGEPEQADDWYDKAIVHTTDPILEAYARIYRIRLATGEDENKRINQAIAELMKLSKRDKYEEYQHIIYYGAGQMELIRKHYDEALGYFLQSGKAAALMPDFRSKVYLEIGNLAFETGRYKIAASAYDSLNNSDPQILDRPYIVTRKELLAVMMKQYETIRVEDSLQRIAAMPEAERNTYIKNMVRKLRKEQGLKEEEALAASQAPAGTSSVLKNEIPADLFATNAQGNSGSGKNDWYFYNNSMKAQGFRQFKQTFGNRPNIDNWRRIKALAAVAVGAVPEQEDPTTLPVGVNNKTMPAELTAEGLMANVPMTPQAIKLSNDSIMYAYAELGKILQEKIGDCPGLIKNNEEFLNRFQQSPYVEEALFQLIFCLRKTGNTDREKFYKDYMTRNFSQSMYLRMLNDPKQVDKENKLLNTLATAKYDEVYNKFIEGDFENALREKKKADSTFGESYWTPQLLYIESVYYIKQKQDSTAIMTLQKLASLYPSSPMAAKASTMIDVLKRRSEIESYLTQLEVTRADEEKVTVVDEPAKVPQTAPVAVAPPKPKETVTKEVTKAPEVKSTNKPVQAKADTTKLLAPKMETTAKGYIFNPSDQHVAVLLLNKVDVVYVNEARNALNRYNREKYAGNNLQVANEVLDTDRKMIVVSSFSGLPDAREWVDKARAGAASEIFPWLPKDKYSFFLISQLNFELLKTRKDIAEYLDLLNKQLSVK